MSEPERVDTVVIGGGQAGLATGYYLARLARDFVLLMIGNDGYPRHHRGVVEGRAGPVFRRVPLQHALSSALIGDVGADARYVVEQISARAGRSM